MNILIRSLAFGVMTGIYSVAVTYSTVGFPIASLEDKLRVLALFTIAGIGGLYAYRRDPEAAWKVGPVAKTGLALIVLTLGVNTFGCAVQPIAKEPPLGMKQCEALVQAAAKARTAGDLGSAATLSMTARQGGCF